MKSIIKTVLVSSLLVTVSYAADVHHHEEHAQATGVEALSPELRNLLTEEMKALQEGMMSLIPAYISGNWSEVEVTAEKIKSSYILSQSLTEGQIHELHSIMPEEFIEKDQNFHYLAGMLEHAAQERKPELMNFYFSEMTESCANCHAEFATHRFPAFKPVEMEVHAH